MPNLPLQLQRVFKPKLHPNTLHFYLYIPKKQQQNFQNTMCELKKTKMEEHLSSPPPPASRHFNLNEQPNDEDEEMEEGSREEDFNQNEEPSDMGGEAHLPFDLNQDPPLSPQPEAAQNDTNRSHHQSGSITLVSM